MKQRQHRQRHRVRRRAQPDAARDRVVHDAAVRVHAALGLARGARGVGHHGQIVGAGGDGPGAQTGGQGVHPCAGAGFFDRLARRADEGRHGQVGGRRQVVAIGRHHGMAQARRLRIGSGGRQAFVQQRAHLGPQVLRREDGARAGIQHVVAQLLAQVHRVHRHHHRVGAQDGVVANDELRAVLQVQQHAVTPAHAAALLQVGRQALALVLQARIADGRVVEHQRRLVRVAHGRDLEVAVQVRGRQCQVLRQQARPMGQVALGHGVPQRLSSAM